MPGLTGSLLLGVLLLPIAGAIIARLLGRHWGQSATRLVGGGAFLGAIACLLALQRAPLDAAALGRLSIFLPSRDVVVSRDALVLLPTAAPMTAREPTRTATSSPSPAPAETATAMLEPTPTPTPVLPPTAAAPPSIAAPARQPERYVVQRGDTLRRIAGRFDIPVEAILRYNRLSPQASDSLRVGQEIFIPPR